MRESSFRVHMLTILQQLTAKLSNFPFFAQFFQYIVGSAIVAQYLLCSLCIKNKQH